MKANQKFVMDEEAVSPVIAVILMVAITVVLAATVFVLVSDLGGDVGQSSPKLQLVQDSTSSATKAVIKVSDATRSAALVDYEIMHTTPAGDTIVYTISSDTAFKGATFKETLYSVDVAAADGGDRYGSSATDTAVSDATASYRLVFMDVNNDDQWNVLDTLTITYDAAGETTANALYDNTLPKGNHKLEFRHVPTGSISGTLSLNA